MVDCDLTEFGKTDFNVRPGLNAELTPGVEMFMSDLHFFKVGKSLFSSSALKTR
jgi:hypothetical protein